MAETINMDVLAQVGMAWAGKQAALAEATGELQAAREDLATIEARIQAAGAYEHALETHVAELEARLAELRTSSTPEERALQGRLAEMRRDMAQVEVALGDLRRLHQLELEAAAAVIRRQRGGDLSPRVSPAVNDAEMALAHILERQAAAAGENAL